MPTPPPVVLPAPAGPTAPSRHDRLHPGWTLVVVCAAVFMLLLDVTIVSVALADLQRDLSAGLDDLQWVVDAYTLTLAGGLLTAATLGDRIGRRRVFAAGLAVFTTASLACALAQSTGQLNGARAVQGAGAALLFGTALPLLGTAFPDPARRARAIGAFGATMAAATAIGPLVGGALVSGPGWRWIFLVNVPVGLAALLATRRLSESRPETARRADWAGSALLTGSLLALLVALIRGNGTGWTSPTILGLLAAAAVLGAGFVVRERLAREPMLDLGLFARPAFAGVALQAFAMAATLVAATYYVALFLQTTMGFSPFATGLRVLPLTVAAFAAAPLTAALQRRIGTSVPLVAGLALSASGLLLATALDARSSWTVLVPGFVLAGLGLGAGMAASSDAALAAVQPQRAGMATGTVNTVRQVGTAAGVAILGALFQHRGQHLTLPSVLPEAARERIADAVGAGAGVRVVEALPSSVPTPVRAAVATAARQASTDALDAVLLTAGWAVLAATLATAVLLWAGSRRRAGTDDLVSSR